MRFWRFRIAVIVVGAFTSLLAQTPPDVGTGAPSAGIQASFINAFYRNNFNSLVSLPPLGEVKRIGPAGLVQEFADVNKTAGVKYALVRADNTPPKVVTDNGSDVLQMYPALYSYWLTVGTTNAGYPITDTLACRSVASEPTATCQWQLFNKPAALFVYTSTFIPNAQFNTVDPIYTKWQNLGGMTTAGPAIGAQQTVTSSAGTTATTQAFDQAQIFNITSGVLNGRMAAVGSVVNGLYVANNGYTGFLGFPTGDEAPQPDGSVKQVFEGGAITYVPGSPPVLVYPVRSVNIVPQSTLRMNLNDTLTVQATLRDVNGALLTGRTVAWSTSDSRVVSIQPSGYTATLKAVGGGSATIQARSEGQSSPTLSILVTAPCCDIGDGSPSPAVKQAFQDAVTRNKLSLRLPIPAGVRRSGSGYVQDVQDAAAGAPYLLTVADRSVAGYVLGGALLAAYNGMGGPSGSLGYPTSDATAGGRQLFANQAALAGNPVQLVAGPFLTKWAGFSYETGAAGSPISGAMPALSFRATAGQVQSFAKGTMFMATTGPGAGSVYFAGGLVAAAYNQSGGMGGSLGFPTSDEYSSNGKRRQDFEGGFIDYAAGNAVAQVHPGTRQPIVEATPATVAAGSHIRLAVGGFDSGSTIRVSITGQPDFVVTTVNGAYTWTAVVPVAAKSATIQIHAADSTSGAAADGSYIVRAASEVRYQISKISGDNQTGQPGAALPQALRVLVKDDSGNPAAGMTVSFSASPGAAITPSSAVTDANGQAQASFRLAPSDGIALATADAGHQVVTFSAQAVHSSLAAFPAMTQAVDQPLGNGTDTIRMDGALLTSAAAILRYYQNTGALPTPNGYADPTQLNQFLTTFCVPDTSGGQICDGFIAHPDTQEQFVNLWRVGAFVGGNVDVSIEKADLGAVRDWISQGAPLVLELGLSSNGSRAGAHYVVATGVGADGAIAIMDPNPALARTNLNDYLAGFTAASTSWKGTLEQVVRLIPRAPLSRGFLVTGKTPATISSAAGTCGAPLALNPSAGGSGVGASPVFANRCDGAAGLYQLTVPQDRSLAVAAQKALTEPRAPASGFQLTFTDLGNPGNHADLSGSLGASFKVFQLGAQWTAAAQDLSFASAGVVNAASFTPDLAPGSIFSIFGSGLSGPTGQTTVQVGGAPATVLAQTPFQLNGQIPADIAPGTYTIQVVSPYGLVEQPIVIQPAAPAIFQVGPGLAAIANQDSSLNTPDNPATRGSVIVIYATGLGATAAQGRLQTAIAPVTVTLNGADLKPAFAGLTPGFIGLYQVNVQVPAPSPPGLNLPIQLKEATTSGNIVSVAVQ
jgi:uncharacterized protein (TIGR03437 family)